MSSKKHIVVMELTNETKITPQLKLHFSRASREVLPALYRTKWPSGQYPGELSQSHLM